MNSKILLIALFSLLISFNACNKDEDDIPVFENNSLKIKTETWHTDLGEVASSFYQYDKAGRLYKETYQNGKYTIYTYEQGKIIERLYDAQGTSSSNETYLLNDEGLAISNKSLSFEYDSLGYLVKTIDPGGYLLTTVIEDGNTVESIENEGKENEMKQTYQFLTTDNTIGNENRGKSWLGKQDKNLRSEEHTFYLLANPPEYTVTYSYEFDDLNRVTKKTTIHDEIENIVTYTYY